MVRAPMVAATLLSFGLCMTARVTNAQTDARLAEVRRILRQAGAIATSLPAHPKSGQSFEGTQDGTIELGAHPSAALSQIANSQIRSGDLEGALATLSQLPKGSMSEDMKLRIVALLAEKGDPAGATRAAEGVAGAADVLQNEAIRTQIKGGDIPGALKAIGSLREEGRRRSALAMIVTSYLDAKRFSEALTFLETVKDRGFRAPALLEVARALRVAGAKEESARASALALKETLATKGSDRSILFMAIVVDLARAGNFDEAQKLAAEVKDIDASRTRVGNMMLMSNGVYGVKELLFCQIALEQARAGLFSDAIQLAKTLRDVESKTIQKGNFIVGTKGRYGLQAKVLRQILEEQVKRNDLDGARKTLAEIPSGKPVETVERTSAMRILAVGLAKAGQKDAATSLFEEAVRLSGNGTSRGSALIEIAEAQALSGDKDGSRKTYEQARDLIVGDGKAVSTWALCNLGASQARAGDPEGAAATFQQVIREIERLPADQRSPQLSHLSDTLVALGNYPEALQVVDRITDKDTKVADLKSIARAQTLRSTPKAALTWVESRSDAAEKVFGLIGVADGLIGQVFPSPEGYTKDWDWEPD